MSDARRIRVVYADDNATYRTRLLRSLVTEPEIEVVAVAVNGQAALDAIERHQPDVAPVGLRGVVNRGSTRGEICAALAAAAA